MAGKLVTIIRLSAFLIYLYSIYWQYIVRPPFLSPERKIFGQFIFLTYWNLVNIDIMLITKFDLFHLLNIIATSDRFLFSCID